MNWLRPPVWLSGTAQTLESVDERMAYVIALARRNVQQGTGGPFAAAVFERDSGRLVAVGVNRVLASGCSHAHAEMIAIALAERRCATHDLGQAGLPPMQLVSSCEPCAMCLGAICWSGVADLVCAARDVDARSLGFDEGPKPGDWMAELAGRKIRVQSDVLRTEAVAVIRDYVQRGGPVYSPTRADR